MSIIRSKLRTRLWKRKIYYLLATVATLFVMLLEKDFYSLPKKGTLVVLAIVYLIIFFWGERMERNIFLSVSLFGIFFSLASPIFDMWDEPAHFTRVTYISEGNLILTNDREKWETSKDISKLVELSKYEYREEKNIRDFFDTQLWRYKHNPEKEFQVRVSFTNAYGTIAYLPSVIGYNIGKFVFNNNLGAMFYLGRIFNALFYALCAFFAVKLSKDWKNIVSFFAMLPMIVYTSGTFNQDSFSYGVILLTVSVFLGLLLKKDHEIGYRSIVVYMLLCCLLAFTKLPYIALMGLLFFIPYKKYEDKRIYISMLISILIVIIISACWFYIYSSLAGFPLKENVNPIEQFEYIKNNFKEFIAVMLTSIVGTITKTNQLSQFAMSSQTSLELGIVNVISFGVLFSFPLPQKISLSKWTKFGIFFIAFMICLLIYLSMYLTWTVVGADYVSGVQGRYFFGLLLLTPGMFSISKYIGNFEENKYTDKILQILAILLLIWAAAARVGVYY